MIKKKKKKKKPPTLTKSNLKPWFTDLLKTLIYYILQNPNVLNRRYKLSSL